MVPAYSKCREIPWVRKCAHRCKCTGEAEKQVHWLLSCNILDSQTHYLDDYHTAVELYDALVKEYAGSSFIRKTELYQLLATLRPRHERFNDYLCRALDLRTAFETAKCKDDELISAFFLIGMRDTDHFKDWSIQQLQHDKPAALPELVRSLRTTFRHLLDEYVTAPEPVAHQARSDGKMHCIYCNGTSHTFLGCYQLRSDQKEFDASRAHRRPPRGFPSVSDGRCRGRGYQRGRGRDQARNAMASSSSQARAFYSVAFHATCKPKDIYLDTCASHHFFNDKGCFSDFKHIASTCSFADDSQPAPVRGKGTFIVQFEGEPDTLRDVLYVPTFKSNLISVTKADCEAEHSEH
jgi:hypothetical protein